jgi:predicted GIY-YIG superfamily endonuclease
MTENFRQRMMAHFSGKGSCVTRKYPPVRVERVIPCYNKGYAKMVEHEITRQYIHHYGYANVRGGRWVNSLTF